MDKRQKIGGGILIFAAIELGKDSLSWAWGKILDAWHLGFSWHSLESMPWRNLTALLLGVAGLAIVFWPAPKKPKPPSRSEELQRLYPRSLDIVRRIRASRQTPWFRIELGEDIRDIARDGGSLLIFFDRAQLKVPSFETQSAEKVCVGLETYFAALYPLLRDGHIEEVEASMGAAVSHAELACSSFDPQNWYVERY